MDDWLTIDGNVLYAKLNETTKSSLEAAKDAVAKIVSTYPAPHLLMVSGGVDSQAMLWAWKESGFPFTAYSIKYVSDGILFNGDDLVQLEEFSSLNKIAVTYLEFDILNFLSTSVEDYQIKFRTSSPQIATHMAMSELLPEGTKIFSGNFFYSKDKPPLDNTILGLKRYADESGFSVVPFFFCFTEDLAMSFLSNDNLIDFNVYERKCEIFHRAGFPVIPQPQKMTGFEKIKEYFDPRKELVNPRDKLRYANKASHRVFDVVFRYRMHDKLGYQDDLTIVAIPNTEKPILAQPIRGFISSISI